MDLQHFRISWVSHSILMAFASISGFREGQGGLNEPIHDVLFGVHCAKTGSVKFAHPMAAQIMSVSLRAWGEMGGGGELKNTFYDLLTAVLHT